MPPAAGVRPTTAPLCRGGNLVFAPLPYWSHLSPAQYRRRVLALVEQIEEETALRRGGFDEVRGTSSAQLLPAATNSNLARPIAADPPAVTAIRHGPGVAVRPGRNSAVATPPAPERVTL